MPASLRLELDSGRDADGVPVFATGARVPVTVHASDSSAPASLDWRLSWRTEGKGDTDAGVGNSGKVTKSGGAYRFVIDVPAGPWSYSGHLLKIRWALELWSVSGDVVEVDQPVCVFPSERLDRDASPDPVSDARAGGEPLT